MKYAKEALDNVQMNYNDIKVIAEDMVKPFFEPIDNIVDSLSNVNTLSVDTIRDTILELSISSYKLGEIKDKSSIKSELAEALRKEKYALEYNKSEGTVATKDNTALLESSSEIVADILFELVANLTKTKLDEVHRLVDSLKSILMSRMQELKLGIENIE